MELGRIYGHFAGYFREGLDFFNERGERQYMSRNDYLGGTVLLPIQTENEYRSLPKPGTVLRAVSLLIADTKTGELKTTIQTILYDGDNGFKMPSDEELYAGYRFQGNVFVAKKQHGMRNDRIYRNVILSLFGCSYKLSLADNEPTYDLFPGSGAVTIAGKVDTNINGYEKDGRWRQKCENNLMVELVKAYLDQTQPQKPAVKPSAA